MSDDDSLAALSAAAKNRAAPSRLPPRRPASKPTPSGGRRPGPRRPKKSPLLLILGGMVVFALALIAAVVITIQVTRPSPPAGPAPSRVDHPPGELFSNVPAQGQAAGKGP